MFKYDIHAEMQRTTPRQEVLIQIVSTICKFASTRGQPEDRIEYLNTSIRILSGLASNKNRYIELIAKPFQSKLFEDGSKQKNDKKNHILDMANALNDAFLILDSDNDDWKNAFINQLKATIKKLEAKRDTLLQNATKTHPIGLFDKRQPTGKDRQKRQASPEPTSKVNLNKDNQTQFKVPQPLKKHKEASNHENNDHIESPKNDI